MYERWLGRVDTDNHWWKLETVHEKQNKRKLEKLETIPDYLFKGNRQLLLNPKFLGWKFPVEKTHVVFQIFPIGKTSRISWFQKKSHRQSVPFFLSSLLKLLNQSWSRFFSTSATESYATWAPKIGQNLRWNSEANNPAAKVSRKKPLLKKDTVVWVSKTVQGNEEVNIHV